MRYLSFAPTDEALYQVAHFAVISAPNPRTAGDTRLLGKLQDKVETIGRPAAMPPFFKLGLEGGIIGFEDAEFERFVAMVGAADINSPTIRANKIPLLDRLDAAPTTPPGAAVGQ